MAPKQINEYWEKLRYFCSAPIQYISIHLPGIGRIIWGIHKCIKINEIYIVNINIDFIHNYIIDLLCKWTCILIENTVDILDWKITVYMCTAWLYLAGLCHIRLLSIFFVNDLIHKPMIFYWWLVPINAKRCIITSSNRNIFSVTGPLYGEFTGHRRIPRIEVSGAELRYFLWSAPE